MFGGFQNGEFSFNILGGTIQLVRGGRQLAVLGDFHSNNQQCPILYGPEILKQTLENRSPQTNT